MQESVLHGHPEGRHRPPRAEPCRPSAHLLAVEPMLVHHHAARTGQSPCCDMYTYNQIDSYFKNDDNPFGDCCNLKQSKA
eukprot:scaffold188594_cov33-Prasinocladus_malaysianus.AAC.1